jgi:superfamily II DNA or RNA helicase
MKLNYGYIYIRYHEAYDKYDAFKLGITTNIPDRDTQYATGEIKRGIFEIVFEIPIEKMKNIEYLLHRKFCDFNCKINGGKEFFNKKIINLIEPFLINIGIKYRKLSSQEINTLLRRHRIRESFKKVIQILKLKRTKQIIYIPRNYQTIIIKNAVIHFQKYDKGILVLICGVGKTLISLWITQELKSNTILIGVPSLNLMEQWEKVIRVLFKNVPCLFVSNGLGVKNIMQFLENNQHKCIVVTTYSSAHKVHSATKNLSFVFEMKLLDEVHHLTTSNMKLADNKKTYVQILNIPSVKQLSLTATLKQLESNAIDDDIIVSNDNVEHFGEIIDRKCLLWAINENIICDYDIQTIIANEEQLEQQLSRFHIIDENDKRLFLSAYASLKSIFDGNSHHLLIYANNKDNSSKIIHYIKLLLNDNYFDIPELYYSNYDSEMKSVQQKEILNNFDKAKFGIISCIYCLGEGYDNPNIDGEVFSENMTSNIRIVQSALRASRKNEKDINKKAKIILPILTKDDWLETDDNVDLKKVREIIYQMGLEDETIIQKIKVFKIDIVKQTETQIRKKRENNDEFGEYDDELTKKLRLKTTRRTALSTTYEKARKIIADNNVKSKENYYELCERDNRLSKDPEIKFKGKFTNWIDYLSIKREYYDLETCKNKINEYFSLYSDLKKCHLELSSICTELCKIDQMFPPNGLWTDYYNVTELQDIIIASPHKKKSLII